jgi:flagellar protein FliT
MLQAIHKGPTQAREQMSVAQVIENYEILAALTAQMRIAAEHGNWEELISIEKQCDSLLARMKKIDAETNLDETTRRHKNQLIQKILADEDEIRNLTHEWMEQLQNQISSNRQEQRLQQAYGSSVD